MPEFCIIAQCKSCSRKVPVNNLKVDNVAAAKAAALAAVENYLFDEGECTCRGQNYEITATPVHEV